MKIVNHFIFALVILGTGQKVMAQGACALAHNGGPRAEIHRQIDDLIGKGRAAPDKNAVSLDPRVIAAVKKNELPIFESRLLTLLGNGKGSLTPGRLLRLYQSLYFPKDLIAPRLEMAKNLTAKNIMAVLGDLTYPETLRLTFGPTPEEVSPDSLVGRYLAETGLKLQKHRYQELGQQVLLQNPPRWAPGPPGKVGPERFLVPVDANSFQIYLKYFKNQTGYSVQGHANLVFNGKLYTNSHSPVTSADMGMLGAGTALPWVILKPTEGQRLERYMGGMMTGPAAYWDTAARAPWAVVKTADGQPYTSVGSQYHCCTHWQGNIPIGDRKVTSMILPGPGDQPVVAKINKPSYEDPNTAHVKDIWQYPLNQPISAVLGLAKDNGIGNFASPGWVIQTLLVSAPLERVPFVFWFTQDANVEIGVDQVPRYENPR